MISEDIWKKFNIELNHYIIGKFYEAGYSNSDLSDMARIFERGGFQSGFDDYRVIRGGILEDS